MPDEHPLTLRQVDGARADFAIIEEHLEFLAGQLARMPTRKELRRVGLLGMLSGAFLVESLALVFR